MEATRYLKRWTFKLRTFREMMRSETFTRNQQISRFQKTRLTLAILTGKYIYTRRDLKIYIYKISKMIYFKMFYPQRLTIYPHRHNNVFIIVRKIVFDNPEEALRTRLFNVHFNGVTRHIL